MSDPNKYTVGWISALSTESVAAQLFLDERHDPPDYVSQHDNNVYILGRIGRHNVVMASLPDGEYGLVNAATVARDMQNSFPNVRIGLMVGIGGGAPTITRDIRLGDVVVSSRSGDKGAVFQYDYGKAIQNQVFEHTQYLDQPPALLRSAVGGLRAQYEAYGHGLEEQIAQVLAKEPRLRKKYSRPPTESDQLFRSKVVHRDVCGAECIAKPEHLKKRLERGEEDDSPVIHYGLIASANQLMKDAHIRDKLATESGVLCFEMEAAGLMNHFRCIVIRGICDYADSHKNKQWQGYAAMVAAAYAKDLLSQIPISKIEAERPLGEMIQGVENGVKSLNFEAAEIKATGNAIMTSFQSQEIQDWLKPPDPSTNANQARKLRLEGTGAWLLEHTVYTTWKAGSRPHVWLRGLSGCGKTVLSGQVLEDLEGDIDRCVLGFFFDFGDAEKQTVRGLLLSLAWQLFKTGNRSSVLESLFEAHQQGQRQASSKALAGAVSKMLEALNKVSIVLDALDECTERNELLSWIKTIVTGENTSHVQLICTGRPEAEFEQGLLPLFSRENCLLLDKQGNIDLDIRCYAAARLRQDSDFLAKRLPPDLVIQIESLVGGGASGMFRWAACQLDILARCPSLKAMKAALNDLPMNLNETYDRMLKAIPQQLQSDASRLLHFLLYSRRPLLVSEAIDVLATNMEASPPAFDIDGRAFTSNEILRYCPGLISIIQVPKVFAFEEELHLSHFSVKEYLLKRDGMSLSEAASSITTTCLTYLSDIEDAGPNFYNEFPLADFASLHWAEFAALAEDNEEVVDLCARFIQEDRNLQRSSHFLTEEGRPFGGTPLYFACLQGIVWVAIKLVQGGADVNAQGGEYGNALQAASYEGHIATVKILLTAGADVNAQGGQYGSALQAASYSGHAETVRILLTAEADVNAQGGDCGNALGAASAERFDEIVQILLDAGAEVHADCHDFANSIEAASCSGNDKIVEMLLNAGADVDPPDPMDWSPLYFASEGGHDRIVKVLLERGADVNRNPEGHGSALHVASRHGHERICRKLLTAKADVHIADESGNTPLHQASTEGFSGIVEQLLRAGASVNATNKEGATPLHLASRKGHHAVVSLLFEAGCDMTIQDADGQTPVQYKSGLSPLPGDGYEALLPQGERRKRRRSISDDDTEGGG